VKLQAVFTGLWRDRRFLNFWSAQTVSELGDRISELALPLIAVTVLDATPEQVGLLTAAVWLPNLVSLVIGSWVDQRPDKRRLMIFADLARLVVLLTLPIAYWLGVMSLVQLYAVAILAGTAQVVFSTSYSSFFVRLVRREQFLEANSKLSSTRSLASMIGPAIGGALVQFVSAPVAVIADALSFLFSAVQLNRLEVEEIVPDAAGESLFQRAWSGMRYLLEHPYLRASLACATTLNFFTFIGSTLVILFASRDLGLSPGTIGLALGVGASGGLFGATQAGRIARWIGIGPLIAIASVTLPLALTIIAFASGPVWLRAIEFGAAEFVFAVSVMCFDVPLMSLQASVIADTMRSRVTGAFSTVNFGVRPLGAVLGGLLGGWIGPRETLLVSGIGGALSVLWLIGSPIIRVRTIAALQEQFPPPP
jgi:predicted MFS family arabinose efflux permease